MASCRTVPIALEKVPVPTLPPPQPTNYFFKMRLYRHSPNLIASNVEMKAACTSEMSATMPTSTNLTTQEWN
jgi:hypothetical protein